MLPEKMFIYIMSLYLKLYRQAAAFAALPTCLNILEHVHHAPKTQCAYTC